MKRISKRGRKYDTDTIGLEVKTYPKNRQWQIDSDYADKLTEEERKWLSRFQSEFYGGGPKKGDPNALHNTDELRRKCYELGNASNRDLSSIVSPISFEQLREEEPT